MVVASAVGLSPRVLGQMARLVPPIAHLPPTLQEMASHIDIIHSFNLSWEYPMWVAHRIAQARQIPHVITPFAHLGQGKGDRVALNNTMRHQLQIMRTAAAILTLTAIEKEGLIDYDIVPERIHVIHGGVDPLPTTPPGPPPPHISPPYFLFLGRINYDKGALHCLEAAIRLRTVGREISLVFAGRISDAFQQAYDQLERADQAHIHLLGPVSDDEKQALLANAYALLLPSQADSFGIVFLEAWQHGKPVIGARAGGVPAVVTDQKNGLLIPFGDVPALATAMERLVADPQWARQLGQYGQETVSKRFNWDHVAQTVRNIYLHRLTT